MHRAPLAAVFVALMALVPTYGQEKMDMSKDAMKAKDTASCVKHMEEAHKAMGM